MTPAIHCLRCLPLYLLPLLVLTLTGCKSHAPADTLPTVSMTIGTQRFTIEVANTDKTMKQGLMFRQSMPADRGMIFVFPDERVRDFWMKNTLIPLDILYLDSAGTVVSIHQMKPHDETPVSSDHPAQFAIELNEGAAARCGIKVGHVIDIPATARDLGNGLQ
jgi:uncharacterized membrane protein (UPF0127 family)